MPQSHAALTRRRFLRQSVSTATFASAALAGANRRLGAQPGKTYRIGVIGHTGRGNYGHGLDTVWKLIPEAEIVAVADADAKGRAAAEARLETKGFADYHEMIRVVRPDVVAVCPRHPDQHKDMVLAAIEGGARGVYVEKPYCRTPRETDEIQAACRKTGAKVAVAHRNRYHPTLLAIDHLIASGTEGGIGKLLEIRGRGKGDRRGGAEDLWVLGSHVLNLVAYFGGAPKSCSAVMLQDGRRVTKNDVRDGGEALGPLAGNELHARYEMSKGAIAYFDSIANDGTRNAAFGLQLIGSDGVIDINCDRTPLAHLRRGNPFRPVSDPQPWTPITSAGPGKEEPRQDVAASVAKHILPARDLLASLEEEGRQPLCNSNEGATTVEMICGVFESHRQQSRAVSLPLESRDNALTSL